MRPTIFSHRSLSLLAPRIALAVLPLTLVGCDDPHVAEPTAKSPPSIVMAPEGAYPEGAAFAIGGVPVMKAELEDLVPLMKLIDPHLVDSSLMRMALANIVLPVKSAHALDPAAREEAFQRAQRIHANVRETGTFPPDAPESNLLTGTWGQVGLVPFNAAMSMQPGEYSSLLEAPASWVFFKLLATNLEEGASFDGRTQITIQRYDIPFLPLEASPQWIQEGIDTLPIEIVDPEWEHIIPPAVLYKSRQ